MEFHVMIEAHYFTKLLRKSWGEMGNDCYYTHGWLHPPKWLCLCDMISWHTPPSKIEPTTFWHIPAQPWPCVATSARHPNVRPSNYGNSTKWRVSVVIKPVQTKNLFYKTDYTVHAVFTFFAPQFIATLTMSLSLWTWVSWSFQVWSNWSRKCCLAHIKLKMRAETSLSVQY